MGNKKSRNRICYLCGKTGADSKDHVPPKGLLPAGSNDYQRITVYAHRLCNSNESEDEEYLRDLLLPEAIQYGFSDAEETYQKVWRAWSKPAGWKRYKEFMKTAIPLTTQTSSGIYTGKAVGVIPDEKRVISVARKIVKGIVFYDASAIVPSSDIVVAALTAKDAIEQRQKHNQEKFWLALNSEACKHTMFGDHVAIRRFYQGHGSEEGIFIETHIAIILWNLFVVASADFFLKDAKNKKFKFAIDPTQNEWSQGPKFF